MLCILGFGVFYGVSLSKEGTEHIHGPFEQVNATDRGAAAQTVSNAPAPQEQKADPPEAASPPAERIRPANNSVIGTLLDGAASVLNRAADLLIRLFVKLGEAVLS
jgi:hypothetical protein